MNSATPAKKEWTKPELIRLGTIGSVAGPQANPTQSKNGGS